MTERVIPLPDRPVPEFRLRADIGSVVLAIAALALGLPGLVTLATGYWGSDQGAAGPIILISGLWLLFRERALLPAGFAKLASLWLGIPALLTLGLVDVIASTTGIVWIQMASIFGCELVLLAHTIGWRGVARLWAPLAYLAFLIPLPEVVSLYLTHGLKLLVSDVSLNLLALAGYPVAREGVALYIGQYEVIVAAACAGMNSMISLTALGLFYVYCLHRARRGYALLLCLLLVPVSVVANIVRVVAIMLITYYFGDAVGQSIVHEVAGALIFFVAMIVLVGLDWLMAPWFEALGSRGRLAGGRRA